MDGPYSDKDPFLMHPEAAELLVKSKESAVARLKARLAKHGATPDQIQEQVNALIFNQEAAPDGWRAGECHRYTLARMKRPE